MIFGFKKFSRFDPHQALGTLLSNFTTIKISKMEKNQNFKEGIAIVAPKCYMLVEICLKASIKNLGSGGLTQEVWQRVKNKQKSYILTPSHTPRVRPLTPNFL